MSVLIFELTDEVDEVGVGMLLSFIYVTPVFGTLCSLCHSVHLA